MANYAWKINGMDCELSDGKENGEVFRFKLYDFVREDCREEFKTALERAGEKAQLLLFHAFKQKSADSANTTQADEKFGVIKTELERLLNPSENFNAVRGTGGGSSAIPAACKEMGTLLSSQLQNAWKRAKKSFVLDIDSEKLDSFCIERVFALKPEVPDGKFITKAQWKSAAEMAWGDLLLSPETDFDGCKFD